MKYILETVEVVGNIYKIIMSKERAQVDNLFDWTAVKNWKTIQASDEIQTERQQWKCKTPQISRNT